MMSGESSRVSFSFESFLLFVNHCCSCLYVVSWGILSIYVFCFCLTVHYFLF